jgi:cytoskeletal protein CcmA (bactofilin family)
VTERNFFCALTFSLIIISDVVGILDRILWEGAALMFGFGRKTGRSDVSGESASIPEDTPPTSVDDTQSEITEPAVTEDTWTLDDRHEVVAGNAEDMPYANDGSEEIAVMQNDDLDGGNAELGAAVSPADKAILHIGPGTVLKGDITTCESLVVQGNLNGTVEASLMLLAQGGTVDGTVNVQTAEIEGTFTGTLTVKGLLAVKGGGQIQGTVRYGELEIERGCQLNGDISQHDGASAAQNTGGLISRVAGGNPAGAKAA